MSGSSGDSRDEAARTSQRVRQAKAWSIALDPVYGLIGMGVAGYLIDQAAGTGILWTSIMAVLGLIGGFYRFVRDAIKLNNEQAASSKRTDGDQGT